MYSKEYTECLTAASATLHSRFFNAYSNKKLPGELHFGTY